LIPVERAAAPLLLICGEADNVWPSCPMARAVKARAEQHGRPAVTLLAYRQAGHGVFGMPRSPSDPKLADLAKLGGTPQGNNTARQDNWPKMLAFLDAAPK
jgi:dienelactone hydrolase